MALSSKIKSTVKRAAKKSYRVRSAFNWVQKTRRKRYYRTICSLTPINEKLVVFEAFLGKQYSCSPRAIYEAMKADPRFDGFTFVWVARRPEALRAQISDNRTFVIKYLTRRYFRVIAQAKYLVTNWRLNDAITKRPGQVVIQTWHGTPLKKIGMDLTIEGNATTSQKKGHLSYLNDAKKYDFFVSPSRFCTKVFSSAFGLDRLGKTDILIETGYPRNDRLVTYADEEAAEIRERLGIDPEKKVILYAPTWRDNQHKIGVGYTFDPVEHVETFLREIPDDYVVLVRLHYLVANKLNLSQFGPKVRDCSKWQDINDLYILSDVLITDYSSVFFDYANLCRPILFYMYDLDEYSTQVRDFYIDLDTLPGPVLKTQEELVAALADLDAVRRRYEEAYERFNSTYNYLDDGKAGLRVAERCILGEVR